MTWIVRTSKFSRVPGLTCGMFGIRHVSYTVGHARRVCFYRIVKVIEPTRALCYVQPNVFHIRSKIFCYRRKIYLKVYFRILHDIHLLKNPIFLNDHKFDPMLFMYTSKHFFVWIPYFWLPHKRHNNAPAHRSNLAKVF